MGMHLMGGHLICIDFEFLTFKIVSGKDDLYLAIAYLGKYANGLSGHSDRSATAIGVINVGRPS
jgi:hypothetical protein